MTDLSPQIEWIRHLVAYDTTSSRSNLALIEHVETRLNELGVTSHRVTSKNGKKANLYAIVGPEVSDGVVLSGHTDVVPVDGQAWDTDPWTLTEKEGKFYGRGTCDMKSFCAIGLSLVPEMLAANLKRPVIFALSYDEEVGCLGAPDMIAEIRDKVPAPSAVIVGEPTMMKVVDSHKGISTFTTNVTGFTTHSSQTDQGVSAVEAAARLITKISDMREANKKRAEVNNPFDPPYSTLTVNVINGGTQGNIMAATCNFDWDIRVIPVENSKAFLDEFNYYAKQVEVEMKAKAPACSIETRSTANTPPLARQKNNAASELCRSVTGENHTEVVSYAAEAGQFQEAGFATAICGPGSIDQAHKANEFISLDQVAKCTDFIRELIKRLAQ